MSRISTVFSQLREQNAKALITFVTAGDPDLESTLPAIRALVAGGADVIELGVPFSDPEADGPAIQRSSERALSNGTTLRKVLDLVEKFRKEDDITPIVLMGYLNPILAFGVGHFVNRAAQVGVDGLIVVNLPPEETRILSPLLEDKPLDLIPLLAPTTSLDRVREIATQASGFLYYIAIKGITGADHLSVSSVQQHVQSIKEVTEIPVAVGFGIKTPEIAKEVARFADGVVVGSALVETMARMKPLDRMTQQLTEQATALSEAVSAN